MRDGREAVIVVGMGSGLSVTSRAEITTRYAKAYVRASTQVKGRSTTKASPLLRSSIKIRKATDEVEAAPGFFEGDTVGHCGPALKDEFARTPNLTDMRTGWVFTRTVRNNAHTHIIGALTASTTEIPSALAAGQQPAQLPDPHHRTHRLRLGPWRSRRRHYDKPMTSLDRLLAAGVLSPAQQAEPLAYRDSPNPAASGRARALRTALPTIAELTVWGMRSGEKFLFDRGP